MDATQLSGIMNPNTRQLTPVSTDWFWFITLAHTNGITRAVTMRSATAKLQMNALPLSFRKSCGHQKNNPGKNFKIAKS